MKTSDTLIVFDFFGVICSEIAPFWLERYFTKNVAIDVKNTVVHSADTGELSQQEMFSKLGELAHISSQQVETEWSSFVVIDEEVVEIIRSLRDTHTLALLTNSPSPFVRNILDANNLSQLFSGIIVSSEERCAKPSAAIYERLLDRLSIPPESALMIDDNPVNVRGALSIGMGGLLFESNTQLRESLVDLGFLTNYPELPFK